MPDLTPETLADLRRLYEVAFAVAAPENDWEEWTSKAAEAFPALLEAAGRLTEVEAERDALAAKVELVRSLHPKVGREMHYCLGCDEKSNVFQTQWPCSTIRALDGEATP